jgi:hypothetical protein
MMAIALLMIALRHRMTIQQPGKSDLEAVALSEFLAVSCYRPR